MRKTPVVLFLLSLTLGAQSRFEFWPGTKYDPAIPTVTQVLGFELGTRHATPADIVRYFEALAAAAPSRMKVVEYGKTWEGRRLIYAVLSGAENMRRIAEIQAAQMSLADPRKTPAADARKIIAGQPAVIGLSYGVHGNEISSPDAALMTAYHLLAARGDAMVDAILKDVVVLIDPLQNPDGRERFIQNFRASEGLEPDAYPQAAERAEPWPGGRSNHYLFDMNRDWAALTQPESLARVRYLRGWLPLVFCDLHEMGGDSTYFFTPGAPPYNPHLTQTQKEQMALFGKNDAKWFDQFGYSYFTRETFDEFYPGYGASWPWFYGGMGMTYENASVRGLVLRRNDETLYTYQDSVRKHFIGSIATCETAKDNRAKLLESFWQYQVSAVQEGRKEAVKEYILPRRGDVSAVDKLAGLLAEHGTEIRKAAAAFRNGGKEYPAGSYLISMAQPRKRFLRTLLDPTTPMEADFLKEQERRRKKKLRDEIYDVTAWNMPMLYNVECVAAAEASQGDFQLVTPPYKPQGSVSGRAKVAYLVPWGTQAAGRFLAAALRDGLKLQSANKPFTLGGKKYPSGTLILQVAQNPAGIHEKVARHAAASGAEVTATDSSWVDDGINFGSNNVLTLKKPAVMMIWDTPTSSLAAGATRFVLERQYGYPVTAVRPAALMMADLSRFHVIILPEGNYGTAISPVVTDRLRTWVRNGGVLIGLGGGSVWMGNPQTGLLAMQVESLARDTAGRPADAAKPAAGAGAAPGPAAAGGPAAPGAPPSTPGKILAKQEDLDKAIQPDTELPDEVAGVLVRARVDNEHWIGAGVSETINVMLNGRNIFAPIKRDRGVNAATFLGPEELLASGYLWEENRKQLAYKPFVAVQNDGRGAVVAFTADPTFRGFMDGLNVIFLNAVFRGPASVGVPRQPGEE